MRCILLFGLATLFSLQTVGGDLIDVGCDGERTSVQALPYSTRRSLKANWKPCYTEKNTRITGKAIKRLYKVKRSRQCCVACKNVQECVSWAFYKKNNKCTLFSNKKDLKRSRSSNHISGSLKWRLAGPTKNTDVNDGSTDPVYEDPNVGGDPIASISPGLRQVDGSVPGPGPWDLADTDPSPSPSNTNWNSTFLDTNSPPPPSTPGVTQAAMPGKIMYGRRLNSYTPCKGNIAPSYQNCASSCSTMAGCTAWTFVNGFDCTWVNQGDAVGLCYLMADVGVNAVYDAQSGDYFTSGWI